jgi:hypothetical protein
MTVSQTSLGFGDFDSFEECWPGTYIYIYIYMYVYIRVCVCVSHDLPTTLDSDLSFLDDFMFVSFLH